MRTGATLKNKHLYCALLKHIVYIEKNRMCKKNSLRKPTYTKVILFLQRNSSLLISHKTKAIYFSFADI